MTRVNKGWIAVHLLNRDKDNARARSFDSGEPIYVEQIPSDAIRCETTIMLYDPAQLVVSVPAHLIGRKVEVIIIEKENTNESN